MFKDYIKEFTKGIFKLNPTFVIILGLCPTLAITTSIDNAIGMGVAATFVLLFSELVISLIRKLIPENVRIPIFIVIIATFVTITQMVLKAFFPSIDNALGIFIPLIVVNCIIFARVEEFASKMNPIKSILDALGIGLGFTLAISLISAIREILGTGKLLFYGKVLLDVSTAYEPAIIFLLAPGALLVMGLLLALFNWIGSLDIKKQSSHIDRYNDSCAICNKKSCITNRDNKKVAEVGGCK